MSVETARKLVVPEEASGVYLRGRTDMVDQPMLDH